jgi:hypothetical protein
MNNNAKTTYPFCAGLESATTPFAVVFITCCKCGIYFAIPKGYAEILERDKKSFCCPNGHRICAPPEDEPEGAPLSDNQANLLRLHFEEQTSAMKAELEQLRGTVVKGWPAKRKTRPRPSTD